MSRTNPKAGRGLGSQRFGVKPRRGFTLVELILALAVSALVTTAVSAMLLGVSYGTSARRELRGAVVRGETIDGRIAAAIRSSRAVLEAGPNHLALWRADTRENDGPDLSEITLIERGSDGTLKAYGFPTTWTPSQIDAAEANYMLSGNPPGHFLAAASSAKSAGWFVPTLWGNSISAVSFTLNASDPANITLVSYRVTLQTGDLSDTIIGSAAVRHQALGGS
jgi:prepilin-type N-terminal cleavage/methylation domain-containing protein